MATLDVSCLYSTIKNTSGGTKKFGFLPPHGRELAANEEFTIFGDARQIFGGNRGSERSVGRRDIMAFEAAVQRGDLQIIQTPSPIIQDVTTNASRMFELDDGTLSTVDPCWYDSVS